MDLVFLFIILLFVIVYFFTCDTTEGFADTATKIGDMTRNELESTIYQIYKADVLAIKNLADTATKLQAGGITIPGNLVVNGNQKVDGTMEIKGATTIGGKVAITGGGTINGGLTIDDVTFASLIKRIEDLETKTKNIATNGNSASFTSITAPTINVRNLELPGGMWIRADDGNHRISFYTNWNQSAMFLNADNNWQK